MKTRILCGFSLLTLSCGFGQVPNDLAPASLPPTASYKLEWQRHFGFKSDMAPASAADDAGTLWLLCTQVLGDPRSFWLRSTQMGTFCPNTGRKYR